MRTLLSVVALATALSAAGAVAAQDPRAPAADSITKRVGFTPETITASLTSGGNIDAASTLGGACVGMVASAPNYAFTYTAGSAPLFMSVRSQGDTTLVVHNPNGNWGCSDDYNGVNPALRWDQPESGTYLVWVGSIGGAAPAVLSITETE